MKNNLALSGIVFITLVSIFSSSAFATPSCVFAGNVTVNGNAVAGNSVHAYLNGTGEYLATGIPGYPDGKYNIPIPEGNDGKYIIFKVENSSLPFNNTVEQGPQLCNDPDHYTIVHLTVVDGDSDGYAPPEDCDDSNPAINPGATELCNGIDDDCNGQIDDGLPLATCGVGACARTGTTCDPASCTQGTPDAMETCGDGVDNDCDGAVDNGCGGGGGGGGGAGAYCGDGILQKWTGEECEKDIACNSTSFACNLTSCKCICQENWSCGAWGECSTGGAQTRICTDSNACGTTLQKPSESQSCTYTSGGGSTQTPLTEIVCGDAVCDTEAGETCETCEQDCGACAGATTEETGGFNVLGMFIGTQGAGILGLILLLAIMLLLLMATKRKKKKK